MDAEAHWPPGSGDHELLQDGASVQQEGEVLVLDEEVAEAKLPEVGERSSRREVGCACVREAPGADVELGEGGAVEELGGGYGQLVVELDARFTKTSSLTPLAARSLSQSSNLSG